MVEFNKKMATEKRELKEVRHEPRGYLGKNIFRDRERPITNPPRYKGA